MPKSTRANTTSLHSGDNNRGNGSNGTADPGFVARQFYALKSALVDRLQFASRHGFTFDGKRNVNQALGYNDVITWQDYRDRYRRGGISKTIIEAYPDKTWGTGFTIVEDQDPEIVTDFEQQLLSLYSRLNLTSQFHRADIQCGVGLYSVLLIGVAGTSDLTTPLPPLNAPDDILFLTPYPQWRAKITKVVTDLRDKRLGLPLTYSIGIGEAPTYNQDGDITDPSNISFQWAEVHYSRIIYVADGLFEDRLFGTPRLRPVWNYLDDLLKNSGGGSEAVWNTMNPPLHANLDPEYGSNLPPDKLKEQKDAISAQMDELIHGQRRKLLTSGVNLNQLSSSVAQFGPNVDCILKLISATTRIPYNILVGRERGDLASESDDDAWEERAGQNRRIKFAIPIVKEFIDRMIEAGAIKAPTLHNGEYEVVWPEVEELNTTQKASVLLAMAQANQAQVKASGQIILTADEMRADVLGKEALSDSDRLAAQKPVVEPSADPNIDPNTGDPSGTPPTAALRANDPEYKAMHRAAKLYQAQVANTVLGAWQDAALTLDMERLQSVLETGSAHEAEKVTDAAIDEAERLLRERLEPKLLSTLVEGGTSVLRGVRGRGSWFAKGRAAKATKDVKDVSMLAHHNRNLLFSVSFNVNSPRAIAYATDRSNALVTEISPDTREALRELIVRGLTDGIPPRELSQRIRESVGLRTDQIRAVDNLILELASAEPGTLVTRIPARVGLRDIPGFRAKVPDEGASIEWVAAQAERYSTMALNYRARTIARTETLRASNEGQKELWLQAQDDGILPRDGSVKRMWIGTDDERERDEHVEMNDQITGIDEPFDPDIEPGSEPNCRCGQGLVEVEIETTV